jgi:beta-lactam-binding protein with PASTA domain
MSNVLVRSARALRSLFANGYFWAGLGTLLAVALVFYVLVNHLVMPAYTRHDVTVEVPSVRNLSFEEAEEKLEARDLRVERVTERFDPELPRDVIVDQNPLPRERVKPGRRVYLTVNTGQVPHVTVPSVEGMSLREARNQLQAHQLDVEERPDSIPSPYRNTITRQKPAPGDSIREGSTVTLWYSTGLGQEYVTVPDVTGLLVQEARERLLGRNLRSVVVGQRDEDTFEGLGDPVIVRQSREPGTRVREGFEIRLFLGSDEDVSPDEERL